MPQQWVVGKLTADTYLEVVDKNSVVETPAIDNVVSQTVNSAKFVQDTEIEPVI